MAFQDCIAEIKRLSGREDLSDTELEQISEKVNSIVRRVSGEDVADLEAIVLDAIEGEMQDLKAAAVIEKRNAALNLRKRIESLDYLRSVWEDRPDIGLEAILAGVATARQGSRRSVGAAQEALTAEYLEGMMARLKQDDVLEVFVSGAMDREIWRAMHEITQPEPNQTVLGKLPDEAVKAAQILNDYNELARVRANRAGAWIRALPGRVIKQTHDMFRIRDEGFDAWYEFVSARLDWEKSLPDVAPENRKDVLRTVFTELASGVHLRFQDGGATGFTGFANIGKRLSHERVLHFKDADASFDYNARFGSGTLSEGMLFGLERMAQDTALMEHLGPNAEMNLDWIISEAAKLLKDRDPAELTRFDNKAKWIKRTLWPNITGEARVPERHMLAQVSSGMRAWQQMSKLGGAMLSAIPDLAFYASEVRYQGGSLFSGLSDALTSLGRNTSKAEYLRMMSDMGIMVDSVRAGVAARFDVSDRLPGRVAKTTQLFFKLSGLRWWTDQLRKGAALTFSNRLAKATSSAWDGLDDSLKRVLGMYGIEADKWDLLRGASARAMDGREYLVPEVLDDVADDAFAAYLQKRGVNATQRRIADLREEVKADLRNFYADRAKMAVIEPDAKTRAYLLQGTKPGTWSGEILRHLVLFKSFIASVVQKPLARELHGRSPEVGGAMRRLMTNQNGEMTGLATLIVVNGALGYLAMSAKDAVKGREPRDPNNYKTWLAALAQGGSMGIYGDFLFGDMKNRFGGSAISTLAGPTAGTFDSLVDIFQRMRDGDDVAASAFRTLLNNTPFLNLFYTRIVLDYLILHRISEALNPGYLRRMERRIERENEQEYWAPPSEHIPYGGF